ncbi:hypothetical protein [Halalkalicoccus subterraneus]|uniref:hypothetical protein n=1 Tax=Halalkalicoccus subterraneus TaxID=2675002 RepID=UPI001FE7C08B|nr:hypothetical protein [Halalkalicoccus subterraneus]
MRDNDHEERSSVSRRSYIGALAGIAATPALGSLAGADGENVITVSGEGSTAYYEFSVSGDIEKSDANDATINSYDSIDGTSVEGRTTNEPDSYAFSGEVSDFESSASVTVTINGEPADFGDTDDSESDSESDADEDVDADESGYSEVVDIVEAGADNSGGSSIESVLEDVAGDGTLVKFPSGEYRISGTVRLTNYSKFGMVGDDATIKVEPTDGYTFKLGTYSSPIDDLHVEGFTVDITGSNTGGRVFELQAGNDLYAGDLTVEGKHDTASKGPMLVGMQNSGGDGLVENVDLSDGGEDVSGGRGGTGLLVSDYHSGSVTIKDCQIGPFPDNGIYCSSDEGEVHVEGGSFENTNVAGVRLDGDSCSLKNAEFEYDEEISGFGGQRPVRCDGGDIEISGLDIYMSINQTECIRVMSGAESVSIEDCSISGGGARDAVSVTSGAGSVDADGIDVEGGVRETVYHY